MYVNDDQVFEYIMDDHEIENYEQNKPLKRRAAFKKYMGSIKKKSNRPPSDILRLAMAETKDRLGQGLLQLEEVDLDEKDLPEYFDDFEDIPGILTVTRESSVSYSLTDNSDISINVPSPATNDDEERQVSNSTRSLNIDQKDTNTQTNPKLVIAQWSSEPKLQIASDFKQTKVSKDLEEIKCLPSKTNPSQNFNFETKHDSKEQEVEIKPSIIQNNVHTKHKKEEQKHKVAKTGTPTFGKLFGNSKTEDDDLKHFKQFEKDFLRFLEHDEERVWKSAVLPPKSPKPNSSQPTKDKEAQERDKKINSSPENKQDEEDSPRHRQKSNLNKINFPKNYFSTLPYRKSKRKKKSLEVLEKAVKDDQAISAPRKKSNLNSPQKHLVSPKHGNLGRNITAALRPAKKTIENELLMQILDQEKEQNWKVVVLTEEQKEKMKEKRLNKLKNIENQKRKEEEEKQKREQEALTVKMIEETEAKTQEMKSNDTIELTVKGAFVVPTENDGSSDDVSSLRSPISLQNMTQRFSSLRRIKSAKTGDKSPTFTPRISIDFTDKQNKETHNSTFSLDRGKSKLSRTESLHHSIESYKQKLRDSKRRYRSTPSSGSKTDLSNAGTINLSSALEKSAKRNIKSEETKNNDKRNKNVNESGKLLLQKAASLVSFKNLKEYQKRKSPRGSKLSLSSQDNTNASEEFWWNASTTSLADDDITR